MGSKKRSKTKVEGTATNRRVEEIRQLFNDSELKTLTPTPTIKTAPSAVGSVAGSMDKTRSQVYESATTKTQAPLRTVISSSPYQAAKRIDVREEENEKTEWWLGPVLILGALLLFGLGWLHIERSGSIAHPVGHTTSTLEAVRRENEAKVEFYRKQLGHRLNRDRVNVELQNSRSAPAIEPGAVRQTDRSMMSGVPLMQENYVDQNYGPRTESQPVPIDRPDARIQYSLQEEQHRAEFDRRVEQRDIDEFVENARREGVHVILDADANVINVERITGSDRGGKTRTPGSALPGTAR